MKHIPTLFTLILFSAYFVRAQGAFVNLGFESANLPPVPQGQFGSFVPISQALPGWMSFFGTNAASSVLQNNFALGSPSISILGPDWTTAQGIIEGQYTVLLQGSNRNGDPDTSLSQIGAIPMGRLSLRFKAASANYLGMVDFTVSFSGQQLSPVPLSSGPNYTLYGADISAFSGDTGELRFAALSYTTHVNNLFLDSIVFSPDPVPEPAPIALLGVSATLFFLWFRCRRRPVG